MATRSGPSIVKVVPNFGFRCRTFNAAPLPQVQTPEHVPPEIIQTGRDHPEDPRDRAEKTRQAVVRLQAPLKRVVASDTTGDNTKRISKKKAATQPAAPAKKRKTCHQKPSRPPVKKAVNKKKSSEDLDYEPTAGNWQSRRERPSRRVTQAKLNYCEDEEVPDIVPEEETVNPENEAKENAATESPPDLSEVGRDDSGKKLPETQKKKRGPPCKNGQLAQLSTLDPVAVASVDVLSAAQKSHTKTITYSEGHAGKKHPTKRPPHHAPHVPPETPDTLPRSPPVDDAILHGASSALSFLAGRRGFSPVELPPVAPAPVPRGLVDLKKITGLSAMSSAYRDAPSIRMTSTVDGTIRGAAEDDSNGDPADLFNLVVRVGQWTKLKADCVTVAEPHFRSTPETIKYRADVAASIEKLLRSHSRFSVDSQQPSASPYFPSTIDLVAQVKNAISDNEKLTEEAVQKFDNDIASFLTESRGTLTSALKAFRETHARNAGKLDELKRVLEDYHAH